MKNKRINLLYPLLIFIVAMFFSGSAGAANGSVLYTYDALGRVVAASYDTGVCIQYQYDANGNRTSQAITVGSCTTPVWGTAVWGVFTWTPH